MVWNWDDTFFCKNPSQSNIFSVIEGIWSGKEALRYDLIFKDDRGVGQETDIGGKFSGFW